MRPSLDLQNMFFIVLDHVAMQTLICNQGVQDPNDEQILGHRILDLKTLTAFSFSKISSNLKNICFDLHSNYQALSG